jgi:hypothetical protein
MFSELALCSQSSHNSTNQALTNCTSSESQTVTCHTLTSVPFFFMRTCVLRVPNMTDYTFLTALAPLQLKVTVLAARNKALCQQLSITWCCDHHTLCEAIIAATQWKETLSPSNE